MIQSFSKAGVPYDNSVMESFFSSLKREELYRTKYRSEAEFRAAVDAYMVFYNERRPCLLYTSASQNEELANGGPENGGVAAHRADGPKGAPLPGDAVDADAYAAVSPKGKQRLSSP